MKLPIRFIYLFMEGSRTPTFSAPYRFLLLSHRHWRVPDPRRVPHWVLHQHRGLILLHGVWPRIHSGSWRPLMWRYSKGLVNLYVWLLVLSCAIWPLIMITVSQCPMMISVCVCVCVQMQMWMNVKTTASVWEASVPTPSVPTPAPAPLV